MREIIAEILSFEEQAMDAMLELGIPEDEAEAMIEDMGLNYE